MRHCLAQAVHRFFHERGFFWVNTPIITASDAEGAGQMFRVSTLDLANLPRTERGKVDFSQGLLRQGGLPHRLGPAQRRGVLPGAEQGLHVRADLPRRELEHHAAPGRVLDDRARDRLRRPQRRRDLAEGSEVRVPAVLDERLTTSRSSRAHGARPRWGRAPAEVRRRAVRAHRLHRGDQAAAEVQARSSSTR
jgi:hypothetical protein